MLVGVSKKSFLGAILAKEGGRNTEPNERSWATAAAVACAVQQGATAVRVHDTKEMADVVRVADAIWGPEALGATSLE
jgi:dihydropteroate synthase